MGESEFRLAGAFSIPNHTAALGEPLAPALFIIDSHQHRAVFNVGVLHGRLSFRLKSGNHNICVRLGFGRRGGSQLTSFELNSNFTGAVKSIALFPSVCVDSECARRYVIVGFLLE